MKRLLSILIVLLLCISAFWGCSDQSLVNGNENAEDPPNTTFDFDSYEEMINAFSSKKQNSEGYTIQGLKRLMGETYAHFVDKVKSDKSFPHPMLEGDPITYRNEEGFSNITFLGNELYNLPWIWYFPTVSTGENFYIAITYLPDGERQRNMTASEVIKELSPNSANIDNLGKQHENICNRQIALGDREVTALVIEYKEDTRDSIFFVYEDLLVMVRCNSDVWSDQWFSTLSFDTISK
ncbi:MAG TPA: hypothetical protein GX011_07060 [Clostridiales bacterium]|jgi:hypothetical protein|nr:hypothetical protein [Clostridiales bacterium]